MAIKIIPKRKIHIISVAVILATIGCVRERQQTESNSTSAEGSALVSLCRSIDYSDTATLHDKMIMKKTMVEIVKLLPYTDSVASTEALTIFFNGVKHDDEAMEQAASLADLYLNNPASPVRNASLYTRLLKSMLAVDSLPEAVKLRAEDRLRAASLNCPGTLANDFIFEDRNEGKNSMHAVKGNEILVIFYDPECSHCNDILKRIAHDSVINRAVADGFLTVLAVYAEGKRDVWDSTKRSLPRNWTVGYDLTGILDKDLYDLPAMPTMYLLDGDHRVIFKDPEAAAVRDYLRSNFAERRRRTGAS